MSRLQESRMLVALMLAALAAGPNAGAEDSAPAAVLNLYNWEDYLGPPEIIQRFEARSGITVHLETFDDEDVMVSGLQSHPEHYDLVITSGRLVGELIDMRLLSPLDLSRLPNFQHIDEAFRNPAYDPGNRYSVPYLWGTTALAVNRKHVTEPPTSWRILWNPAYRGKISMLPSASETVGAALKLLGYSLNSAEPAELEAARQKLLEQRPLLAGYIDTITVRDQLIAGELWAAQVYVGEGLFAASKNPDVAYLIPDEGATIWVDNLIVPRDAQHKDAAHQFINYLLEPEVSAAIANYHWYANPNRAARAHTLPDILNSPALYPPAAVLGKCEVLRSVGMTKEGQRRQQLINRIWAELQRAP